MFRGSKMICELLCDEKLPNKHYDLVIFWRSMAATPGFAAQFGHYGNKLAGC